VISLWVRVVTYAECVYGCNSASACSLQYRRRLRRKGLQRIESACKFPADKGDMMDRAAKTWQSKVRQGGVTKRAASRCLYPQMQVREGAQQMAACREHDWMRGKAERHGDAEGDFAYRRS
jgi:hypothetical protein